MADNLYAPKRRSVSPRLALELAQDGIEKQLTFIDAIDSKLSTVIGFSTAIVTVFGGLLAVARRDVPQESVWLLVAAGVVYLALMAAALNALWPRDWLFTPPLHPTTALPKRTDEILEEDLAWAANEFDNMFYVNEPATECKANLLSAALALLALEAALLVASSAVFLFGSDGTGPATSSADAEQVTAAVVEGAGVSPEPLSYRS